MKWWNFVKNKLISFVAKVSINWIYYLGALLVVFVLGWFGIDVQPPPKPDEPVFPDGWINDPDKVQDVKKTLEFPEFQDTPAFKAVQGDDPEEVFLWKAYDKIGKSYRVKNQGGVGSCVGFGTSSAAEVSFVVHLASKNGRINVPPTVEFVEEVTYGGSRVEIGGGRIGGDGSIGAWAAKFVKEYGTVFRGVHGQYDLTRYSESLCREFGRRGVPDPLEKLAKETPVKDYSQVRTVAEAYKALANGWAIMVCSNQGFSSRRDSQGFAAAQGSWAHCMFFMGYQKGNRPGFYCMNSWGENWNSGPVGKGEPPQGGFWVDERVAARMLSQGDSWALSDIKGFEPRPIDKLDWFNVTHRGIVDKHFALAP